MEDAKFWDSIAEKYIESPMRDVPSYEYTMGRAVTYLHQDDHVLELGCGSGKTAQRLAGHVAQVTASDVSPEMIRIAEELRKESKVDNMTLRAASLFDHDVLEGQFDAVFALNLLHLIEDFDAALQHIAGLVKPGGYFISKTGCIASTKPGILKLGIWSFIGIMKVLGKAPPFIGNLRVEDYDAAVERAGFKILETGNHPASPPVRFVVAQKI